MWFWHYSKDMEEMKASKKVVHVKLKKPLNGQTDFYFTSKKAVTTALGKEVTDIGETYLANTKLTESAFENRKCVISQYPLHTLADARKHREKHETNT